MSWIIKWEAMDPDGDFQSGRYVTEEDHDLSLEEAFDTIVSLIEQKGWSITRLEFLNNDK